MKPRFNGLWKHPDFVRLWAGETISIFGSLIGGLAMKFTALIWLDAGAIDLAILTACEIVPAFAVGIFAGVWADRLARRPLMIAADILRALALGSVPLAAVFDVLTLSQLAAVLLATSTLNVIFNVAYEAYLPTLVERDDLVEGNAKLAASASVAEAGSFGISGWLVQLLSGPGAVLVDAVSFLFSAFFLARIRRPEPPPAPLHERDHVLGEAREGMRYVLRQPILRTFAAVSALAYLSHGLIGVAFLLYLHEEVGFSPGVLGLIFGVGGITSLGGAWLAGRPEIFGPLGRSLVAATFLRAIGSLFMPLAGSVSPGGVALLVGNQLVTDPASTFYDIHATSLRQAIAEDHLRGRVSATFRVAGFGAMILGTGLAALVGEVWGARQVLFIAAGLAFAETVVLALSPVARLGGGTPVPVLVEEVHG